MVFHWSLNDSESPQVSWTRLRILVVLSNAIIWIVSTRLLTSKSPIPQLFQFPSKVEVLILLFTFFQFYSVVSRDSKVDYFASSLFFIIIKSGLLAGIKWSVCMLKSHRRLCVAFSRTGARLCIYNLLVRSNLNFLHISQWITLLIQSCLVLYSRCSNLLHSLIIWLMVPSLSSHSLHLLFCWVLSILALIWLVLMALSCAAIRR